MPGAATPLAARGGEGVGEGGVPGPAPADAYPFRTLSPPLRFAMAFASVSVVFVINRLAGTVVDDGSQFLLLSIAVMASAWFGGTGPAIAATLLGAILGSIETRPTAAAGAATP